MIVDKRDLIRYLGFRRIIKARNLASKRKSIRSSQPPKTNFPATYYIEMIHWNTITLSPPPFLRRFSNQEIRSKVQSGGTAAEWDFDKFPCHTQAVERCVKLVTQASQKAFGSNSRDGFIITTLLSISSMPSFSSKSYFKVPKKLASKGLYDEILHNQQHLFLSMEIRQFFCKKSGFSEESCINKL
ncbi:hypothetical protein AVEN_166199-1 [Araneus ventricosus]|uniref:Uncharacterized protein n=1 Tax=Araneus ventricosus TaxID=182803 RepID=A0A4Y2DEP9_ARAVE|nr:hypothetical protein AVEN_166199-1 [Araneus ventricosus]